MSSFARLLGVLLLLGIPTGAMRFLGKAYNQGQPKQFSIFFVTSLMLLISSSLIGIAIVLALRNKLQTLTNLPIPFLYLACIIAFTTIMYLMFKSVFICIQRTQVIALSALLGNIIKLGLGVFLIFLGYKNP
jgi:O-antigen/teichoic acid export membrane protein